MKYALTKLERAELGAAISSFALTDELYQRHSIEAGPHHETTEALRSAAQKLGIELTRPAR